MCIIFSISSFFSFLSMIMNTRCGRVVIAPSPPELTMITVSFRNDDNQTKCSMSLTDSNSTSITPELQIWRTGMIQSSRWVHKDIYQWKAYSKRVSSWAGAINRKPRRKLSQANKKINDLSIDLMEHTATFCKATISNTQAEINTLEQRIKEKSTTEKFKEITTVIQELQSKQQKH